MTVSFLRSLESTGSVCQLKDTKTATSRRTVDIAESTGEALARHRARQARAGLDVETGLVFTDKPGDFLRHHNHFAPMVAKAGVLLIPPYNLRHICAVILLTVGVNIKVVSERLGHSSVRITLDHNASFLPELQKMAADTMEKLLAPNRHPTGQDARFRGALY